MVAQLNPLSSSSRRPKWISLVALAFVSFLFFSWQHRSPAVAPEDASAVADTTKHAPFVQSPECKALHEKFVEIHDSLRPDKLEPPLSPEGRVLHGGVSDFGIGSKKKPRDVCWMYNTRYAPYLEGEIAGQSRLNDCIPSDTAILVLVRGSMEYSEDVTLHLRALIAEAGWVHGFHIHILVHLEATPEEQAEWLATMAPPEFRPFMTMITFDLVSTGLDPTGVESIGHNNHIAFTWFSNTHPQYETVWGIESDARYIGRWSDLFTDVNATYTREATRRNTAAREAASWHAPEDDELAPPEPPVQLPGRPDLTTLASVCPQFEDWHWYRECKTEHYRANTVHSLLVLFALSRRLVDLMTLLMAEAVNCHLEAFAPTTAALHNLTSFFYEPPLYGVDPPALERHTCPETDAYSVFTAQRDVATGGTYSWAVDESMPWYVEWRDNPAVCRPEGIVHPVKL